VTDRVLILLSRCSLLAGVVAEVDGESTSESSIVRSRSLFGVVVTALRLAGREGRGLAAAALTPEVARPRVRAGGVLNPKGEAGRGSLSLASLQGLAAKASVTFSERFSRGCVPADEFSFFCCSGALAAAARVVEGFDVSLVPLVTLAAAGAAAFAFA